MTCPRCVSPLLLAVVVCALLAGCGQKGPLVLPEAAGTSAAPPAGGAEETTSDEPDEDSDG